MMFTCAVLCRRRLLRSHHIDISYFAAGIASHVLSDGSQYWTLSETSRGEMLHELVGNIYINIYIIYIHVYIYIYKINTPGVNRALVEFSFRYYA